MFSCVFVYMFVFLLVISFSLIFVEYFVVIKFPFTLDADFHETLSTLQTASKVRNIQNNVTKNKVSSRSCRRNAICRDNDL